MEQFFIWDPRISFLPCYFPSDIKYINDIEYTLLNFLQGTSRILSGIFQLFPVFHPLWSIPYYSWVVRCLFSVVKMKHDSKWSRYNLSFYLNFVVISKKKPSFLSFLHKDIIIQVALQLTERVWILFSHDAIGKQSMCMDKMILRAELNEPMP